MAKRKTRAVLKSTLLIVGEGAADKAFIDHLKQTLEIKSSVKVKAGDGGSPGNIITHAIRVHQGPAYDRRLLVLDSDIPVSAQEHKTAAQAGYEILLWSPVCLEGVLLEVLQESVCTHETSQDLKKRLHPRLDGSSTDSKAYKKLFPKPCLENASNISLLDLLRG